MPKSNGEALALKPAAPSCWTAFIRIFPRAKPGGDPEQHTHRSEAVGAIVANDPRANQALDEPVAKSTHCPCGDSIGVVDMAVVASSQRDAVAGEIFAHNGAESAVEDPPGVVVSAVEPAFVGTGGNSLQVLCEPSVASSPTARADDTVDTFSLGAEVADSTLCPCGGSVGVVGTALVASSQHDAVAGEISVHNGVAAESTEHASVSLLDPAFVVSTGTVVHSADCVLQIVGVGECGHPREDNLFLDPGVDKGVGRAHDEAQHHLGESAAASAPAVSSTAVPCCTDKAVQHETRAESFAMVDSSSQDGVAAGVMCDSIGGADDSVPYEYDELLLCFMAISGQTDAAKALIVAGAPVDAKDCYLGRTCLMWAAQHGQADVVRLLLEFAADIHQEDDAGRTAVMLSAEAGHADVVRLLLQSRAQLDGRSHEGLSALMYAAVADAPEAVAALLEAGADMDHQDPSFELTALMWAVLGGCQRAAEMLLQHGARPGLQDTDGRTGHEGDGAAAPAKVVQIYADVSQSWDALYE